MKEGRSPLQIGRGYVYTSPKHLMSWYGVHETHVGEGKAIYGLLWTLGLFLKFVICLLYVALRARGWGRGRSSGRELQVID
jgi:hypothetical protein